MNKLVLFFMLIVSVVPSFAFARQQGHPMPLDAYVGKAVFEKVNGKSLRDERIFQKAFRHTVGNKVYKKFQEAGGRYFQSLADIHREGGMLVTSLQNIVDPDFRTKLFIHPSKGYVDVCWYDPENYERSVLFLHDGRVIDLHKKDIGYCVNMSTTEYLSVVSAHEAAAQRADTRAGTGKPANVRSGTEASQRFAGIPAAMAVMRMELTPRYHWTRKNRMHLKLRNGELDFFFTIGGGPFVANGFVMHGDERLTIYTEGKTQESTPIYTQPFVRITGNNVNIEERWAQDTNFYFPVLAAGVSALKGVIRSCNNTVVRQHTEGDYVVVRDQPIDPLTTDVAYVPQAKSQAQNSQITVRPGSVASGLPISRNIHRPDGTIGF